MILVVDFRHKMSNRKAKADAEFRQRITDLGGRVVGDYVNAHTKVECHCCNGHICLPTPAKIQQGRGMCRICAGNDSETAEEDFRQRIAAMGGTVIGKYVNNHTQVECRCPNGHSCLPTSGRIKRGRGMCRICSGNDPEIAERNFRQVITTMNGQIIGDYVNNHTQVECRCPNGHICHPYPANIRQGRELCRICSERDPRMAEENFHQAIASAGGTVVGDYVNNHTQVECRCPNGHTCYPYPANIRQGRGLCFACSGKDPEIAEENFYQTIAAAGGVVMGDYMGACVRVECYCPNGHKCWPTPNGVSQGYNMCRICSGKDVKTIEGNFRQTIAAMGGTVVGDYVNACSKVECRCPNGHKCWPTPNRIQQKRGMCGKCRLKTEELVFEWLQSQTFISNVTRQQKFDWCRNPITHKYLLFDFECHVDGSKIIIEVDGFQHSKQVANWSSVEIARNRDIYKAFLVMDHDYAIIRIKQEDIWNNRAADNSKQYLDRVLKPVLLSIQPRQCWFMGSQDFYARHYEETESIRTGNHHGVVLNENSEEYTAVNISIESLRTIQLVFTVI